MLTEIKPKRQQSAGTHTCNGNYGWRGEHKAFKAIYKCPECGHEETLEQCAAWPITLQDCEGCGTSLDCGLDAKRAKCALR